MSIEAKGRVLGVDYGDVRTGIAISDEGRFLASGLATLRENGMLKPQSFQVRSLTWAATQFLRDRDF